MECSAFQTVRLEWGLVLECERRRERRRSRPNFRLRPKLFTNLTGNRFQSSSPQAHSVHCDQTLAILSCCDRSDRLQLVVEPEERTYKLQDQIIKYFLSNYSICRGFICIGMFFLVNVDTSTGVYPFIRTCLNHSLWMIRKEYLQDKHMNFENINTSTCINNKKQMFDKNIKILYIKLFGKTNFLL